MATSRHPGLRLCTGTSQLHVAVGPLERRLHRPHDGRAELGERAAYLLEHSGVHLGVANDAPASRCLRPSGLELRLHQQQEIGLRRGTGEERARHRSQRDERQVGHHDVDRSADGGSIEGADVGALPKVDALVVAETLVELAVPHIDGDDLARPALEETVGEPTGRRAGVERAATLDEDPEAVEPGGELVSRPRLRTARAYHDDRPRGHESCGLVSHRAADDDAPVDDELRGAFAARSETSSDEFRIEATPGTQ